MEHWPFIFLKSLFYYFNLIHNSFMKNFYSLLSSKLTFAFTCVLFIVCSYWIYKNVKLTDLIGTQTGVSKTTPKDQGGVAKKTLKLEIRDGNIAWVLSPDSLKLVVNHSKLEGVERIVSLSYSNKTNKMCFVAETLTPQWMYIANTDGTGIKKVALAVKCEISPDGNYVSFINHTTDVSKRDVYLYDIAKDKITNLTEKSFVEGYLRNYLDIKWVSDKTIEASYKDWSEKDYQIGINGVSLVDILSGSVSEKVN